MNSEKFVSLTNEDLMETEGGTISGALILVLIAISGIAGCAVGYNVGSETAKVEIRGKKAERFIFDSGI